MAKASVSYQKEIVRLRAVIGQMEGAQGVKPVGRAPAEAGVHAAALGVCMAVWRHGAYLCTTPRGGGVAS